MHPDIFDFIHDVLTLAPLDDKNPEEHGDYEEAILSFAMSFQHRRQRRCDRTASSNSARV